MYDKEQRGNEYIINLTTKNDGYVGKDRRGDKDEK